MLGNLANICEVQVSKLWTFLLAEELLYQVKVLKFLSDVRIFRTQYASSV